MKALDIALKDMLRSFRSFFAIVFMFIVPLLVTGMFYFMFGNIAENGGFSLPRTKVIIANMDEGGPKFQVNPKNIPGGKKAELDGRTGRQHFGKRRDGRADRGLVRTGPGSCPRCRRRQEAQVAHRHPGELLQRIRGYLRRVRHRVLPGPHPDHRPGDHPRHHEPLHGRHVGREDRRQSLSGGCRTRRAHVDRAGRPEYLEFPWQKQKMWKMNLLDVRSRSSAEPSEAEQSENMLLSIISPIMGGMMIFYAFFTGASTAQSILKEEEERTLPRLFTTPTSQATILSGKLLSVFLTVLVQVTVLLLAARLIFKIHWGDTLSITLMAIGIVFSASSFGIFINSFLKDTKQGGVLFGGVLTVTGMLGMISIFAMNSPAAAKLGNSVSLLVPQGWAVRGLMQSMNGEPLSACSSTR